MNHLPPHNHIHDRLEKLRLSAESNHSRGPVTMIVGPTDVGKSTLTRSLLNLAAIHGRNPLFVDLDVGQTSSSIPGTLGKLPIRKPLGRNETFDEEELIIYYFGYLSPGDSFQLYCYLVKRLGETLKYHTSVDKNINDSGVIIDTCGWVQGAGYKAIMEISAAFEIDVALVVGDKDLHAQLSDDLPSHVEKVFIPKLRGSVRRDQRMRKRNRQNKIHQYFYGYRENIRPYIFDLKFSDVKIFTITTVDASYTGQNRISGNLCIDRVDVVPELLHQVLGVSHAQQFEDIIRQSVYGFICFINIDMDSEIIEVLSPQPSPLPNNILLLGDIKLENR